MSYEAAHYNTVFEAMREHFGDNWYIGIQARQWIAWRKQIKDKFFDEEILISEMINGLDEAAGKGKWPRGVSFFARLHDVVLKNRRERPWTVRPDQGLTGIGSLLKAPQR